MISLKQLFKSTAFLAIICCLLWSTAFAGSKIALKYMPPLQLAGIRFFVSGLILFIVFGKYRLYFTILNKHTLFILWVAFLQTFLMYSFFYTGLNLVPGAVGAMVIGSGPLFAALVAHFFVPDDRITWKLGFGMMLGIAGIVIINYGRQVTGIAGPMELLGVFILILNNLVGGAYNVVVMKSKHEIHPVMLSSMSLAIGGLALFLVSIPVEGIEFKPLPAEFWAAFAWLSMLSAVSFSIWFSLLKRPGIKISNLNTWKFLIPVAGAFLSWWLLPDEYPDVYSIIGMLVIGSSLLVINFQLPGSRFFKEKINSVNKLDQIP
jgi:drug/metabolite transporter (DMT)-like permease